MEGIEAALDAARRATIEATKPPGWSVAVVGMASLAGLVLGFAFGSGLGVVVRAGALSWWLSGLLILLAYLIGGAVVRRSETLKRRASGE